MKKEQFKKKRIIFSNLKDYPEFSKQFNEMNLLFSYILKTKRPDLFKHTPYRISLFPLVEKNEWTGGDYVAIEQKDGTLELYLAFEKIKQYESFPIHSLVWVLFHEFRHKIQQSNEQISSVLKFPNWNNFNTYMQKTIKKSEDLINHIFHELNPAEVDANIFACEMTGGKFNGNAFNITPDSLKKLSKK